MSFRENLLQKIRVDRLSQSVIDSIGSISGGYKIDKADMKTLLEMAGYDSLTRRGLEMHARDFTGDKNRIVLLDNELKIYNTTVEDIVVRKNPTLREMVKIRNIRKILNDQDVVVSSRVETVKTIRREILQHIDLGFTASDIDHFCGEAADALEQNRPEEVTGILEIFAEILGLAPPDTGPTGNLAIFGYQRESAGDLKYGPIYIYSLPKNMLHRYNVILSAADSKNPGTYGELIHGKAEPEIEGVEVLDDLREKVLALPVHEIPID